MLFVLPEALSCSAFYDRAQLYPKTLAVEGYSRMDFAIVIYCSMTFKATLDYVPKNNWGLEWTRLSSQQFPSSKASGFGSRFKGDQGLLRGLWDLVTTYSWGCHPTYNWGNPYKPT